MQILVIDDDPRILRVIARSLRGLHQVTAMESAREALTLLGSTSFDVILCDQQMPEMSGVVFVMQLSPGNAKRVVFMTGAETVEQEGLAEKHPMLFKPFTKVVLLAAIDELLVSPVAA